MPTCAKNWPKKSAAGWFSRNIWTKCCNDCKAAMERNVGAPKNILEV